MRMRRVAIGVLLMVVQSAIATQSDPPANDQSANTGETPRIELLLPSPLTDAQWKSTLEALNLGARADLAEAFASYQSGWSDLSKALGELAKDSENAARTKDTVEQAAAIDAVFKRSGRVIDQAASLDNNLFAALAAAGGEPQALDVQRLQGELQRAQAYTALARMPIWTECTVDVAKVVEQLSAQGVDLSAIKDLVAARSLADTPTIQSTARLCREVLVKDQTIMLQYKALADTPGSEAAANDLMEQRQRLWRRVVSAAKTLKSANQGLVVALVQSLPESQAALLRETFDERWHPRIYGQKKNLRLMFLKAKEIEGNSKEYSELADNLEREFVTRFDVVANKSVRAEDDWIERRLQQQPIARTDMDDYRRSVLALTAERNDVGNDAWAKLLAPLPPEKRTVLQNWMSPTAGQKPASKSGSSKPVGRGGAGDLLVK